MQDEATTAKAGTELSVDAAEFRLPQGPAEPTASAAATTIDTNSAERTSAAEAPKGHPAAQTNGITTENGVDEKASKTAATTNGLETPSESEDSESSTETREEEGVSAQKSSKGGAVAKMIAKMNLESNLKEKPAMANGLPNGSAAGKEEALLNKDPIVVQANGE